MAEVDVGESSVDELELVSGGITFGMLAELLPWVLLSKLANEGIGCVNSL